MSTVNEQLQSASIGHAVDLQYLSNAEVRKIIRLLNSVDADLRVKLMEAIERLGPDSYAARRLNTVLASVYELNKSVYASIGEVMAESVVDIGQYEVGYQAALFAKVIPGQVLAQVSLNTIHLAQVREIALARPFQGRLLKEWVGDLEARRAAKIRDTIRIGMVEGQATGQIVRSIMGTKAQGYADGIINRSRHDVESMVRTAISHTAQGAREAYYKANGDIVAEVRWLSTLDTKTSELCRVRDQRVYTNDDAHLPVGHDYPWRSGPGKIHWRCRSTSTPIIASYEALKLAKGLPEGTRASMDGQVPASTTYAEWLAKQPAGRQDQILGPARAKMMRASGLKLEAFYNDKGRQLTLEQLRDRLL